MVTASTPGQVETRERKPRATREGYVVSNKGDKTIVVQYRFLMRHPKYGKFIKRWSKLHAHDEKNEARIGDRVVVMTCRPISKTKSWRLVKVLERQ